MGESKRRGRGTGRRSSVSCANPRTAVQLGIVGPPEVPWVALGFLKALRSGAISVRRVIQDYSAPTPFPYLLSFSKILLLAIAGKTERHVLSLQQTKSDWFSPRTQRCVLTSPIYSRSLEGYLSQITEKKVPSTLHFTILKSGRT